MKLYNIFKESKGYIWGSSETEKPTLDRKKIPVILIFGIEEYDLCKYEGHTYLCITTSTNFNNYWVINSLLLNQLIVF